MFATLFLSVWGIGFIIGGIGHRQWLYFPPGLFFLWMAWASWRSERRQQMIFATYTFAWYQLNYPDHVKGDRVRCSECNSSQVRIQHLRNQTYFRKHFCGKCGETLYYTPE